MPPIALNAADVKLPPERPSKPAGSFIMLETSTIPVKAQTITVSQNVPVIPTNAWRTGFLVWAAAAAIGAEPKPDSFENKPLAIP